MHCPPLVTQHMLSPQALPHFASSWLAGCTSSLQYSATDERAALQVCAADSEHMAHAEGAQSLLEAAQSCSCHSGPSEGHPSACCIRPAAQAARCSQGCAGMLQRAPGPAALPAAEGCRCCCPDGLQEKTGQRACWLSLRTRSVHDDSLQTCC